VNRQFIRRANSGNSLTPGEHSPAAAAVASARMRFGLLEGVPRQHSMRIHESHGGGEVAQAGIGWRQRGHICKGNQVYTIPTYAAAFKWILTSDEVRNSFFHAFLPDLGIQSSERIDEHMHPVQARQLLRNFLQEPATCATVKRLSLLDARARVVQHPSDGNGSPVEDENGTAFLRQIVQRFQDIKASFPEPRYEGKMDFACRLSSGGYCDKEYWIPVS
jgi:hypothetical protein